MSNSLPSLIKIGGPETMGHEIVFRQTDSPLAALGYEDDMWIVEYWRPEVMVPVADAVVHVLPDVRYLSLLFVMEGWRRQGIGTALFQAIRQRWPDVSYDAVSEEGEAFLGHFANRA